MADYPGAVKNFLTLEDGVDTVLAQHMNERGDEITAIETELGADVAGSISDLVTRLAVGINDDGTTKISALKDYATSASAGTSKALSALKIYYGSVSITTGASQAITNLGFTSNATYVVLTGTGIAGGSSTSGANIVKNSGAQFTLTNPDGATVIVNWMAIGT